MDEGEANLIMGRWIIVLALLLVNVTGGAGPPATMSSIKGNPVINEVARLFADSGCVALTAFISPYIGDRYRSRALHEPDGLPSLEIFLDVAACIEACLGLLRRREPDCVRVRS